MRIIFGWNNFLIKSYNPFELGLVKDPNSDFMLELRQNYFHFFWIPFFGTGKEWYIRQNTDLYEIPSEFKDLLDNYKFHTKSPWYTFSGFIMIFIAYIGYIGYGKYETYKSYQNDILWIEQKADKINNPQVNDLYKLNSSDGSFIMKVDNIQGDSILFDVPMVENENAHYKTNSYRDESKNSISVWLTKEELLECCAKKPEDFYDFEGQKIEKLHFLSTDEFRLDRVDRE